MNAKKQKQIANNIARELTPIILERIKEAGPNWEKPCVFPAHEKTGLFVSLTEEDEHDRFLPWGEFEKSVLTSDEEIVVKYLPHFENLVKKMRKIKQAA